MTLGSAVKNQWNPDSSKGEISDSVSSKEDIKIPYIEITGDSVFVRSGPDTSYEKMGIVHKGDKLHYFGYEYPSNGWRLIEFQGQTGWVSNKYSEIIKME